MTFNFNFNMNALYETYDGETTKSWTNSKNWFTPISIKLSELGDIKSKLDSALFTSYDELYNNNSGNHNDEYNGWIFNVNNKEDYSYSQIASLTTAERLNNTYINNLLWTNDTPSSGKEIWSSVWFKIMAFNEENNLIQMEYQFINTFSAISPQKPPSYEKTNANWNLQTTSLVINLKSST